MKNSKILKTAFKSLKQIIDQEEFKQYLCKNQMILMNRRAVKNLRF